MKRLINSIEEIVDLKDVILSASQWIKIDQEMINHFAEVTKDIQWIHTDIVKAKKQSEYHSTVAHGYLLLSLIPYLLFQTIEFKGLEKTVNYSIDKLIFRAPVIENSRIRLLPKITSSKDLGHICLSTIHCIIEVEGQEKAALEGDIKYLFYFK